MHISRSTVAHLLLIMVVASIVLFTTRNAPENPLVLTTVPTATTTVELVVAAATSSSATSTPISKPQKVAATTTLKAPEKTSNKAPESVPERAPNELVRIENPYNTPALPFETVNTSSRAALVNIYCFTGKSGMLKPITGSGVFVSPRGVILTNAHVAQYVLIAQSGKSDLTCEVRTGAPAVSKWHAKVLYLPPVWINLHAGDIVKSHVVGTGEHDYALLFVSDAIDGSPLPAAFPYTSPDSREAIAFVNDLVLAASYPVEFVGGAAIQGNLYPVSSITTVRQLMTFSVGTADAISLGGIIGAQSGSSGGGVFNEWGRLVGLITTTSAGETTGVRDLHAISTAHIDRDLRANTGASLSEYLAADPLSAAAAFAPQIEEMTQKLFSVILGS